MATIADNKILGLPRRPQIGDASAGTILGVIAGGLLLGGGFGGAVIGGLAGNALTSQKQPLETAIRQFFLQKGLEVIFFHRAPRAVKVTFRYAPDAYWTIETVMPDDLNLSSAEDRDDWLYGSLTFVEFPKVRRKIRRPARERQTPRR
jgi:hypothetical protein